MEATRQMVSGDLPFSQLGGVVKMECERNAKKADARLEILAVLKRAQAD